MKPWDTRYMQRKIGQLTSENQETPWRFVSLRQYATWLFHLDRQYRKPFHAVTGPEIASFLASLREPPSPYSDASCVQAAWSPSAATSSGPSWPIAEASATRSS